MELDGRKKLNIPDALVYIVAFVSGLNFLLKGIYILGIFALIYIAARQRFFATLKILPIIFFGLTYSLFLYINDMGMSEVFAALLLPAVWLFGYMFITERGFDGLFKIIMMLSFGMTAHGILNFIYNIVTGYNYRSGIALDVFSGTVSSVTSQAANFTLFAALAFWLIFIQEKLYLRIISAAVFLIILYYDVCIGGRTFLILSFFSLVFCTVMYISLFLRNRDFFKKGIALILILIILFVIIIIAYDYNWFSVRTTFASTYLNTRLVRGSNIADDKRLEQKLKYIEHMGEFLWGGHSISNKYNLAYAHDIWLDNYNETGIISFIALIVLSINSIIHFIKISLLKAIEGKYRIVFINVLIIILAQFFVEPVMQSLPILFFAFILMDGTVSAFLEKSRRDLRYS